MYDRISTYFKAEWKILVLITVSGLIYNLGLLAGPWFEGKMAGCLIDILGGSKVFSDMAVSGTGLYDFYYSGAELPVSEAFLRAAVCQQCKPEHEAGALWKSDPQKSDGASGRGCGKCNDESNPGCGMTVRKA